MNDAIEDGGPSTGRRGRPPGQPTLRAGLSFGFCGPLGRLEFLRSLRGCVLEFAKRRCASCATEQPEVPLSRRLVRCRNLSCTNTPLNMEVGQARALLEYDLRNNPAASFTLTCDRCGIESSYTYSEILDLIDSQHRPRPLPTGRQWAILPYELTTADTMEYRGFLAERVLVEVVERAPDAWTGTLLRPSQFTPPLALGAHVGGPIVSTFLVCEWWASGQSRMAMPVEGVPKGSIFGIFFGNKGRRLISHHATSSGRTGRRHLQPNR